MDIRLGVTGMTLLVKSSTEKAGGRTRSAALNLVPFHLANKAIRGLGEREKRKGKTGSG